MTQESLRNCKNIYLEAFILPKQSELTIADMEFAHLWLNRGKNPMQGKWAYEENCF